MSAAGLRVTPGPPTRRRRRPRKTARTRSRATSAGRPRGSAPTRVAAGGGRRSDRGWLGGVSAARAVAGVGAPGISRSPSAGAASTSSAASASSSPRHGTPNPQLGVPVLRHRFPREPNFVSARSRAPASGPDDRRARVEIRRSTRRPHRQPVRSRRLLRLRDARDRPRGVAGGRRHADAWSTATRAAAARDSGSRINRSTPRPLLVAVDLDGDGRFRLHAAAAGAHPGRRRPAGSSRSPLPTPSWASRSVLRSPSSTNSRTRPCRQTHRSSRSRSTTGTPPSRRPCRCGGRPAWTEVEACAGRRGTVRIRCHRCRAAPRGQSNPTVVHASPPATRVYWGDLHSHTEMSGDGVGSGCGGGRVRAPRRRPRLLLPDRPQLVLRGRQPRGGLRRVRAVTDAADDPGVFATLHGYEVSFGSPWGHHNVYFRGAPIEVGDEYIATLPESGRRCARDAGAAGPS